MECCDTVLVLLWLITNFNLLSLVDVIAVQTEVLVCLDLIPAAPESSPVKSSFTLLIFSFAGMYIETNEVPFLKLRY